jgi:hypothetical protein
MNLFKTKYSNTLPGVSLLAKVDQLSSYDMIYVYHLLSVGSKLNLTQTEQKLNGDLVYRVMFNTFKLGYITISNFSKILLRDELNIEACVFGLAKEKYLPLKNLEISISKNILKMVS